MNETHTSDQLHNHLNIYNLETFQAMALDLKVNFIDKKLLTVIYENWSIAQIIQGELTESMVILLETTDDHTKYKLSASLYHNSASFEKLDPRFPLPYGGTRRMPFLHVIRRFFNYLKTFLRR